MIRERFVCERVEIQDSLDRVQRAYLGTLTTILVGSGKSGNMSPEARTRAEKLQVINELRKRLDKA